MRLGLGDLDWGIRLTKLKHLRGEICQNGVTFSLLKNIFIIFEFCLIYFYFALVNKFYFTHGQAVGLATLGIKN